MRLTAVIRDYLGSQRTLVAGYLGTSLAATVSPAILFAFSAYLLAKSSLRPGILTLGVAVGSVRFFALARGAGQYGERLLGHRLTLRLVRVVRVALYRAVAAAAPHRVPSAIAGTLSRAATGDLEALSSLILRVGAPLGGAVGAGLVGTIVAWAFDPALGAVLALGLFATLAVAPAIAARLGRSPTRELTATAEAAHTIALAIADSAPERVGTPGERALIGQLAAQIHRLARRRRANAALEVVPASLAGLAEALTIAATVAIGAGAIAHHHLEAVELAVVPFLALGLFEATSGISVSATHLASELASSRRIDSVLSLRGRTQPTTSAQLPDGPLSIDVDHVSFSYPGTTTPILSELSLSIPPEGRLLVVGESGAGKSTLVGLLRAAWEPTEGTVRLGGADTHTLTDATVARHVGYVPQEAWVFDATLAANLRLARPDASDADIVQVLHDVGLAPLLARLPDGLASRLAHDAVSSGEAQRIGLARLLLADQRTWILDEPTANVDGETEDELVALLTRLSVDRTLVVVTHAERVIESLAHGAEVLELRGSPGPMRGSHRHSDS